MSEQVLSLKRLVARIDEKRPTCRSCGAVLYGSDIGQCGPHDGGYHVEGFEEKRWVYVTCASCGYDNSLPKIWEELA